MKKTILTLLALVMLLASVTVIPANAAVPDPGEIVAPMWDNTAMINIAMSFFEDGNGYAEGTVTGKSGVTSIVTDIVVYKKVGTYWIKIAENQTVTNGRSSGFYCQFPATPGVTYKALYVITVTKNGVDEVITKTKIDTFD